MLIPGFASLLVLRAITSPGGGTLMVLCMTSAATSANRDRVYGLWVVGHLLAGAVGLLVLPHLFGLRALYVVLGLLGLCAAPLTCGFHPAVGRMPRGQSKVDTGSASFATIANTVLVIGGVLALYVAIGGVWTCAG